MSVTCVTSLFLFQTGTHSPSVAWHYALFLFFILPTLPYNYTDIIALSDSSSSLTLYKTAAVCISHPILAACPLSPCFIG